MLPRLAAQVLFCRHERVFQSRDVQIVPPPHPCVILFFGLTIRVAFCFGEECGGGREGGEQGGWEERGKG